MFPLFYIFFALIASAAFASGVYFVGFMAMFYGLLLVYLKENEHTEEVKRFIEKYF
jgi:hypothetical protein